MVIEIPQSHHVFAAFAKDLRSLRLMVWQAFHNAVIYKILIKKQGEDVKMVTHLAMFEELFNSGDGKDE